MLRRLDQPGGPACLFPRQVRGWVKLMSVRVAQLAVAKQVREAVGGGQEGVRRGSGGGQVT